MATEWNKLVKETYNLGKLQDPAFTLGQAMKNAKKVYKNGSSMADSLGKSMKRGMRFKGKKQGGKKKTKRRK
jgi:hypothetical protein